MSNSSPTIQARALRVGQNLNSKPLARGPNLASNPLTVDVDGGGRAVLFPQGIVVLFEVSPEREAAFLTGLGNYVDDPQVGQADVMNIRVDQNAQSGLEEGCLVVPDLTTPICQLIAEVLTRNLLLDAYERGLARSFQKVAPLAKALQKDAGRLTKTGDPARQLGQILELQARMIDRPEADETPQVIVENPQLASMHGLLMHELGIHERQVALKHKMEVLDTTAATLRVLVQNRGSQRMGRLTVVLIILLLLVDIGLALYELFFQG